MNPSTAKPTPEADSSRYLELFELIEKHGLFSPEVDEFGARHQDDPELAETLAAARRMKTTSTRALAAEPPRAAAGGIGMAGMLAVIACVALPMAAAFQFALRNAPIASPDLVAQAARKAVDDSSAGLQEKVQHAVVAAMPKSPTDPKAVGELVAAAVRDELAKARPATVASEESLQKLVESAVAVSMKKHEERMLKSFPTPDDVKAVRELIAANNKEIEGLRIALIPKGGFGQTGKRPIWMYTGNQSIWSGMPEMEKYDPTGDKAATSPNFGQYDGKDWLGGSFPDFKNKLKTSDEKKPPKEDKSKSPPKNEAPK